MAQHRDSRSGYSNPWKPARTGLVIVGVFLGLLGTWGVAAPLSGAVIANGALQVEGHRQRVQHPYGGVVRSILVEEAQAVRQGDLLIVLSSTEPAARLKVLRQTQVELLAEKARLIAERDGASNPDFTNFLPEKADPAMRDEVTRSEAAIFQARARQYQARRDVLAQQKRQLQEEATGIRSDIDGLNRQADFIRDDLARAQRLVKAGAAAPARVAELNRKLSEAQASVTSRKAELAASGARSGEAELKLTELDRERVSGIAADLKAVDQKIAETGPNLDTAADALSRTEIRAPVTGHVVGLNVNTEGGVIEAGASLMEIVPSASPLYVDARLKLSDITDIRVGQEADIRLSGVPRNMRPKLSGRVKSISADSLSDKATGAGYYAVQLTINPEDIRKAAFALQPGMPVQAMVETTPRTLFQYLAGPLIDEVTSSFRER